MYGLPIDTDLSFLQDAILIQVCIGENETILRLHPGVAIMIASNVRLVTPTGEEQTFETSIGFGSAVLSVLGDNVSSASVEPPGTLKITWSSGHILYIVDSWSDFESYTVTHGEDVIVV
jgi:hypothetical protein